MDAEPSGTKTRPRPRKPGIGPAAMTGHPTQHALQTTDPDKGPGQTRGPRAQPERRQDGHRARAPNPRVDSRGPLHQPEGDRGAGEHLALLGGGPHLQPHPEGGHPGPPVRPVRVALRGGGGRCQHGHRRQALRAARGPRLQPGHGASLRRRRRAKHRPQHGPARVRREAHLGLW